MATKISKATATHSSGLARFQNSISKKAGMGDYP
jgi:hypothetical protein